MKHFTRLVSMFFCQGFLGLNLQAEQIAEENIPKNSHILFQAQT
jgi:hypothetical protein